MRQEVKRAWLRALRSNTHHQVRDFLGTPNGHCVLGVLAEIAVARGIATRTETMAKDLSDKKVSCYAYNGGIFDLPLEVREWAGLPTGTAYSLMEMNDNGFGFPVLAEWIEKNL